MKATVEVWGVTIGALTLPSLANLKDGMTVASLALAMLFTLWRWRRSAQNRRGNSSRRHRGHREWEDEG